MNRKKPRLVSSVHKAGRSILECYRTIAEYLEKHYLITRALAGVVLFGLFWLICFVGLDPDFGWHLQAGNYILSHGIPGHDIFTYTAQTYRWIDHEWGNDVLVSLLYSHGGYGAVSTLYALLWTGALLVIGWRASLTTLLVATLAFTPYAGSRPLAWTILFFAVLLAILRSKRQKLRWWLPLLFAVWANIHAGFIAGLAVLAYFAIRERRRSLAWILPLCLLATLLNAYGPRIYQEIFRTLLDPSLHGRIIEWHSFAILPESLLFLLLWLGGFAIFDRNKKRILGLSPLLLVAALSASRNLPLFVVSALGELDAYTSSALTALAKKLDVPRGVFTAGFAIGIILVLLISLYPLNFNRDSGYPARAISYLQLHPCAGNLFNDYNAGGYLIWKLPAQPVYIDGRMPTWEPYMNRYESIIHEPTTRYRPEFAIYHIQCALLKKRLLNQKLITVLTKDHWRVVERSDGWLLLVSPR